MGFFQKILVGCGCVACSLLSGQLAAQASAHLESIHASVGSPSPGDLADGTPIYGTPGSTAEAVLKEMASRAAIIFTGTVTAVKKNSDGDLSGKASASVVEVDFAVDYAVKGASAGSVYAMREWAGLWQDSPRFVVGQRVLMLLHAAGPGGLSSPVDGLDGAIPIKATASLAGTPLTTFAAAAATDNVPQQDAVDMRWLQAKTQRSQMIADAPAASPGVSVVGGFNTTQNLGASAASTTMVEPSTRTALNRVLGLLMSWQETGNATH